VVTQNQQKAAKILSENLCRQGGKIKMSEVLREAGYSESVARKPDTVTKSKGWNELIAGVIKEDKDILLPLKNMLHKKEIVSFKGEVIATGQPHSDVLKAIDIYCKISGRYAPIKVKEEKDEFDEMTDEELEEIINNEENAKRYNKFANTKNGRV